MVKNEISGLYFVYNFIFSVTDNKKRFYEIDLE